MAIAKFKRDSLIDCLNIIFVPIENTSSKKGSHPCCRRRAVKSRPLLDAYALCAVRDLYRAILAMTRKLVLQSLIQRPRLPSF